MTSVIVTAEESVILRSAKRSKLRLVRSGYQVYTGELNGRKVKIFRQEVPLHGSFPANQRQRRHSLWFVRVDGEPVGESGRFSDARKLAEDCCVANDPVKVASITVFASNIEAVTSEGQRRSIRLDLVRKGDRVRFLDDAEFELKPRLRASVSADEAGDVLQVNPAAPGLLVHVRSIAKDVIRRRAIFVRPEQVQLIISADDPRVA